MANLFIDLESIPGGSPGGSSPSSARVWLGASHADFASGHNLGALSTGIVITTAGVPSSVAHGTNGHVLTMAGGVPTWAAPAGGGAPTGAQYLALATDATLTAERVFVPGAGLTGTDGGAGGNYTVNVVAADGTITVNADSIQVGVIQTANIADDAVTFAKLQNSAVSGLSVVGRGTTGAADFAEIHANNANEVLYRSGATLAFGLLTDANLSASAAITHSKLADANGASVFGRSSNTTGAMAPILSGSDGQVLRRSGGSVNFGTINSTAAFAGTGTDGFVLTVVAGVPTWQTASGGVTDHGALTGLSDDDHSIYALLAGRSTGQTLTGGTGSAENLTLASTAHATKGEIRLGSSTGLAFNQNTGNVGIGAAAPGAGGYRVQITMATGGSGVQLTAVHSDDIASFVASSSDARSLVCGQYHNSKGGTIGGVAIASKSIIDSGNSSGIMYRVRDSAPHYWFTADVLRLQMQSGGALDFLAVTAPSTPASGRTSLYHDTGDGRMKLKDSAGVVTVLN